MQKITPFLWFNDKAEEAIQYYTSVFPDAAILNLVRYGKGGPGPEGALMTATIRIQGQEFMVLNGGPRFPFTPAISFFISCETQEEVDRLWEQLSEGGEKGRCGWLTDKFGLSWQVIPSALGRLMHDSDPRRSANVMQAMMKMNKISIRQLEEAYAL